MDQNQAGLVGPVEQVQPENQQVAPVQPVAQPYRVPGVQQEPSQEQMYQDLQELMTKIESQYQRFSTLNNQNKAQVQQKKDLMLQEIFDMFVDNGIDPNNAEDVSAFLDSIKQNNPELYQLVEKALQDLMSDPTNESINEVGAAPAEVNNI